MRKGLLMAGIVLIVVAVILFFVSGYIIARQVRPVSMSTTLGPGANVSIGTATPGKVLTVVYTDSINRPLEVYTTEPGVLKVVSINGKYTVAYTVISGEGVLYLMNN
ncbi:MAG: hypothetical protein ACP5NQ_05020, partial [Vulcanisaeta sp.]